MFKLFGGQKQNRGFYLELDEKEEIQPAPEPVVTPKPVAVVEEPPQPVKEPAAKKTAAKKSVKQEKPAAVAQAPAPVAVSPSLATNGSESEPLAVNFATDYLVVQTTSRRLPGPSLKPFKEMASQIKTPRTKA